MKRIPDNATIYTLSDRQKNQLNDAASYILACQNTRGAIYWFKGDKLDPWDHVESAIGLSIANQKNAVEKAFHWLHENQRSDGSWFSQYRDNGKIDLATTTKIETNFVAYPATGLWYCAKALNDFDLIKTYYPLVERAINYVISHQENEGDIGWAIDTKKPLPKDALITACSSILKSIECAILLAHKLNKTKPEWISAYLKLRNALRNKPERFDRTWESKARFSMDWFYPILAGIYSPEQSQQRLEEKWRIFYEQEIGCRCVSDQPWMTIAESCELTLALIASHRIDSAHQLHSRLYQWQDSSVNNAFLLDKINSDALNNDGGFFTGYNFSHNAIWPVEKTSWTNAAMLMAADALYKLTPASDVFEKSHLASYLESMQQ